MVFPDFCHQAVSNSKMQKVNSIESNKVAIAINRAGTNRVAYWGGKHNFQFQSLIPKPKPKTVPGVEWWVGIVYSRSM